MTVKIHKILEGPFEELLEDGKIYYWAEFYVEDLRDFYDVTIGTTDFDRFYKILKHLKSPTIEPYHFNGE